MTGLVLVGHGSHTTPRSSDPITTHADRLRAADGFEEVRAAFWQGEPHLREVVRTVRSRAVTIVPVMMAKGYFTAEVFPRELRLTADQPLECAKLVRYTDPVGTHPALTQVIVSRAKAVTGDPAVGPGVGLALVGHGTDRHRASDATTRDHVSRLQAGNRFDEVRGFFLDEEPRIDGLTEQMSADDIVVVPLFVADGTHTLTDIPDRIGLPPEPDGPTVLRGHRIWYSKAVGTDPVLIDVIRDLASETGDVIYAAGDGDGGNDTKAATRAFGRWLDSAVEGGQGLRQWGELTITVEKTGSDATQYTVRHQQDADTPADGLANRSEVPALCETVRYDDAGRFRPFAGARTLPTGWVAEANNLPDLYRIVDAVYPASIVNWYRDRDGRLDVTRFEEAARRHTGRYGDLDAIPETVRDATVTACCGDCARQPSWTAVDEGNGSDIPCREPCSFLLAAMETFRNIDEEDQSVPTDPSVADGALDRRGNRYRQRYRRARTGEPVPIKGDFQ